MPPPTSSSVVLAPQAEPIPGYRLLCPLGKGGFGEVWKCEAPGGLLKAIKLVPSGSQDSILAPERCGAEQELRALQHVKSIRHPFLLSMERVERVGGNLLIVMELADRNLFQLLREYQDQGLPGIPRDELLGYLREVAEVLDLMNHEYGLQHLDIKPQNLFLVGRHVKVADFGLVSSLAETTGQNPTGLHLPAITPLYAAPESFSGRISLASDQYSLAVVYHELLTGKLPFSGTNFRSLAMQHLSEAPNLSLASPADQAALARALAKTPSERFPTCMDFVATLAAGPDSGPPAATSAGRKSTCPEITPVRKLAQSPVRPSSLSGQAPAAKSRSPAPTIWVPETSQAEVALGDHHFLECLGTSPLGEMWRTHAPDGTECLVKLVSTREIGGLFGDEGPLARLRPLRHPGLVPTTYLMTDPNQLALISEPTPETLARRFQEGRPPRAAGLPRQQVLEWLGQAANTLDDLRNSHQLYHLGLNPRNLILCDEQLLLADFGLVQLVWLPAGQPVAQMNVRYAPPELFLNDPLPQSDQYSLALLYYELVTGAHPLANQSQRQLVQLRASGKFDVDLVSAPEQRLLLKALHPDPELRFANCSELIDALDNAATTMAAAVAARSETPAHASSAQHRTVRPQSGVSALPPRLSGQVPPVRPSALRLTPPVEVPPAVVETDTELGRQVIEEVVHASAGGLEVREYRGVRYTLRPGVSLEHTCYARIVPGTVTLRLSSFCEQWKAHPLSSQTDKHVLRLPLPAGFLRRLLNKRPGMEITVRIDAPRLHHATMSDVLMRLIATDCTEAETREALEVLGPPLIDSLRTHLQAGPERRAQLRLPYQVPVEVVRGDAGGDVQAQVAQGKDISLQGMGLYMRSIPGGETLIVRMQRSALDPVVDVLARVVRIAPCEDGRFEVGLRFLLN